MVKQHYLQGGRALQMRRVQEEIVKLGGWIKVKKGIGEKAFVYYLALELGCTRAKAREYVNMAIEGGAARAKVERYLETKNAPKVKK